MLIASVSASPADSQRDFAPRPGSAYVTDEIWRKAGKNTNKISIKTQPVVAFTKCALLMQVCTVKTR